MSRSGYTDAFDEACAMEAEGTACRQPIPMVSNCSHEYCENRREAARRIRALAQTKGETKP